MVAVPTTVSLWTDPEVAGGVLVARISRWQRLTYGDAVDHRSGLELTAPLISATAVRLGLVARVDAPRGQYEYRVSHRKLDYGGGIATLRADPLITDLGRPRARSTAGGALVFSMADVTAQEVADTILRPALDAEGFTWVALLPLPVTDRRTWDFDGTSILAWYTALAQELSLDVIFHLNRGVYELGLARRGEGQRMVGWWGTNITRRTGLQVEESLESVTTVVEPTGVGGSTPAEAWWPITGVNGNRAILGARRDGMLLPVLEAGQYVGDGTLRLRTTYAELLRRGGDPVIRTVGTSSPTVIGYDATDDVLLVPQGDGNAGPVRRFTRATGAASALPDLTYTPNPTAITQILRDGARIITVAPNAVYANDAATGAQLWRATITNAYVTEIAIDAANDRYLVPLAPASLAAIARSTGAVTTYALPSPMSAGRAVHGPDAFGRYWVTGNQFYACWDPATNSQSGVSSTSQYNAVLGRGLLTAGGTQLLVVATGTSRAFYRFNITAPGAATVSMESLSFDATGLAVDRSIQEVLLPSTTTLTSVGLISAVMGGRTIPGLTAPTYGTPVMATAAGSYLLPAGSSRIVEVPFAARVGRARITDSVRPGTVALSAADFPPAVGDWLRFASDAQGGAYNAIALEPAIRLHGRQLRSVVSTVYRGECNYHRNGSLRRWTGLHTAEDWTFPAVPVASGNTAPVPTACQADGAQTILGRTAGASYAANVLTNFFVVGGSSTILFTATVGGSAAGLTPGDGWVVDFGAVAVQQLVDGIWVNAPSFAYAADLISPLALGLPAYGPIVAGDPYPLVISNTLPPNYRLVIAAGQAVTLGAPDAPAPVQTLQLKGLTAGVVITAGDAVTIGAYVHHAQATATVDGAGRVDVAIAPAATLVGSQAIADGAAVTIGLVSLAGDPNSYGSPWMLEPRWTALDAGAETQLSGQSDGDGPQPTGAVRQVLRGKLKGFPPGWVIQPGDGISYTAWGGYVATVRRRAVVGPDGTVTVDLLCPEGYNAPGAPADGSVVTHYRPPPAVTRGLIPPDGVSGALLPPAGVTATASVARLWVTPVAGRTTLRVTVRGWFWSPHRAYQVGTTLASLELVAQGGLPVGGGVASAGVTGTTLQARTLLQVTLTAVVSITEPTALEARIAARTIHDGFMVASLAAYFGDAEVAPMEYGDSYRLFDLGLRMLQAQGRPRPMYEVGILESTTKVPVGGDLVLHAAPWAIRDIVRIVGAVYEAAVVADGDQVPQEQAAALILDSRPRGLAEVLVAAGVR